MKQLGIVVLNRILAIGYISMQLLAIVLVILIVMLLGLIVAYYIRTKMEKKDD